VSKTEQSTQTHNNTAVLSSLDLSFFFWATYMHHIQDSIVYYR